MIIIDSLYFDSIIDWNTYQSQKQQVLNEIEFELDFFYYNLGLIETAQENEALDALEELNAANEVLQIDFNWKYCAKLWLERCGQGLAYNNTEEQQLWLIAPRYLSGQCPAAGGKGVYHARSLLMLKHNYNWIDYQRCSNQGYSIYKDGNEPEEENLIESELEVILYPNPTNAKFYLSLVGQAEERRIVIANILGNSIRDFVFSENELELDLTNEAAGLYIVNVYNKEAESIFEEKLILLQ